MIDLAHVRLCALVLSTIRSNAENAFLDRQLVPQIWLSLAHTFVDVACILEARAVLLSLVVDAPLIDVGMAS